jgi:hypothetical protein
MGRTSSYLHTYPFSSQNAIQRTSGGELHMTIIAIVSPLFKQPGTLLLQYHLQVTVQRRRLQIPGAG